MSDNRPRSESSEAQQLFDQLYFGTVEKSVEESAYVADTYLKPFNQDDIYQKFGDYGIYEQMLRDDQVSVAMQLKVDLVIGSGWSIVEQTKQTTDMADDLTMRLKEHIECPLDLLLEQMVRASYSFGFSLSEKIFKKMPDGSLSLKNIKTRHPNSWLIHTDKHGNVQNFEQRGKDQNIDVNPKSLIHYVNAPLFQNPYGTSDLRAAYDAWFVKKHIIRFYSIFLEKYAGPTPVAKYKKNTPQSRVDEMFAIIKKFQTKTAIAYPEDFDVTFLELSSQGAADSYVMGINLFNTFIGRSLLIPDLLGFSGSETGGGSYALGEKQIETLVKHITRRRLTLETVINEHIIKPLVFWNYGPTKHYPRFVLNPISEEDSGAHAQTFIAAVQGGVYRPTPQEINHLRSIIKFPETEIEDIKGPLLDDAEVGGDLPPPIPDPQDKLDNLIELPDGKVSENKQGRSLDAAKLKREKRVDFAAIEANMDATDANLLAEAKPLIEEIFQDLFDSLEKKNILGQNPKPEKLEQLQLGKSKLNKLNKLIGQHLLEAYKKSASLARSEIVKTNFTGPIDTDEFLAILESENFNFIKDWEYLITKEVRLEIIAAIKDGRPLSSVQGIMFDKFIQNAQVSLERYSRTKGTEVVNKARVAAFEEAKVVEHFQYSAVLDGRTTEICRDLDGKIFAKGTEPIPPMHFNCRSVLIPITIFEEVTADTKVGGKPIDQYIEENKGKGFPKR